MTTKVTDAQALTDTAIDSFRNWSAPAGLPASWQTIRQQAFQALETQKLPEAKHEEYKFTNLAKVLKKHFELGETTPAGRINLEDVTPFFIPGLAADRVVLVNGEFRADLSDITVPTEQVSVTSLTEGATENSEVFTKVFGQLAKSEDDAYTALNTAFATDGVMITVARNVDVERPLAIYSFVDARTQIARAYPRVLVHAEAGSRVRMVTSVHTLGDYPALNASVNEVYVAANAEVNVVKIQNDSGDSYHYDHTQGYQERDSRFTNTTASLRGTMVRNNLGMVLDAEGIESNMYGVTLLRGKQHVDHHTTVDHRKPHCDSNELYKTILDEKSTGVFNGKIYVRQHAQKTNAFQANNNILLSDDATIHTKPQLEIWADDVKCSHGATIGQMDEEQLFYLRARGLGKNEARAMLLQAFANDALEHVVHESVREYLQSQIADRL